MKDRLRPAHRTGHKRPKGGPLGTRERFWIAAAFAGHAKSKVKVALVVRAELIDPQRFGVTVARNRGLLAQVFDSETDALAWLLDAQGK